MKDKKYYEEVWNKFWNECLQDAKAEFEKSDFDEDDIKNAATVIFEDTANAEQVVGYYIIYHKDDALQDWVDNTKGIKLSEQDKEVDRILKELYK